jgi:hypothetical protein
MANILHSESEGSARRRKEKQASAKLRGRQKFDDQSMVEKVYRWVTKERPYYQNPFTGEKVPPPRD